MPPFTWVASGAVALLASVTVLVNEPELSLSHDKSWMVYAPFIVLFGGRVYLFAIM